MMLQKISRSGMTLIELILYVAIVSIVMSALIPFVLNIVGSGAKSSVMQEVIDNARYVSEKIKYEIRNSNGINVGSSDFDSNLVDGGQLSLVGTGTNDPIIFSVTDGRVMIKQGAATAVALNSIDTSITNLTFSNYSSTDDKTKNIGFVLTIGYKYLGSKQEYNYSVNIEGGAEIRSN